MYQDQAHRLVRSIWDEEFKKSGPVWALAEELHAIFSKPIPLTQRAPITLQMGTSTPALNIDNPGGDALLISGGDTIINGGDVLISGGDTVIGGDQVNIGDNGPVIIGGPGPITIGDVGGTTINIGDGGPINIDGGPINIGGPGPIDFSGVSGEIRIHNTAFEVEGTLDSQLTTAMDDVSITVEWWNPWYVDAPPSTMTVLNWGNGFQGATGDRVWCTLGPDAPGSSASAFWIRQKLPIVAGTPRALFELDATLTPGSSATGSKQEWSGSAWVDSGDNETIHDSRDACYVPSGYLVWAEYNDESGRWELVSEGERFVKVKLDADLTGSSVTCSIWRNGSDTGTNITVHAHINYEGFSGDNAVARWSVDDERWEFADMDCTPPEEE